jgi:hypothetical protein
MSASAYKTREDIANRALQHCRMQRIVSLIPPDSSANAQETAFVYDKAREAELRNNVWRFAIRRCILRAVDYSTLLWTPPTYSASTTYSLGSVVVDSNGDWWQSKVASNTGNTPAVGASWAHYYGPDTCESFVALASSDGPPAAPTLSTTAGGSLGARTEYVKVTYVGADGETVASAESSQAVTASHLLKVTSPVASTGMTGYNVYASDSTGTETLQNASPTTIGTDWTEPTSGLIFGAGIPPSTTPTYYAGELTSLNTVVYLSLVSNNTDTPPTTNWLAVNGTTARLQVLYPVGTGPRRELTTANYFRLPHGFLRRAPEEPKAGINPFLGAPRGPIADDWLLENDYLVSVDTGPIMLRYVGDVVDVPDMDAMFCEMLAARIAEEVAPILVSEAKLLPTILGNVQRHYRDERWKAVTVNGIETGSEDPPEDDYVTCRY